MANIRGRTAEKQAVSAYHLLYAIGEKRHGRDDYKTHSYALSEKRNMYLRDIVKFTNKEGINEKLNLVMSDTIKMDKFLNERLKRINSVSTKANYLRGFSSMIKGLEKSNITIKINQDFFDNKVKDLKNSAKDIVRLDRSIKDFDMKKDELYIKNYTSGVLAEIQVELGLRVTEAYNLIKNAAKCIIDNSVKNIRGKGNHYYQQKPISHELVAKINKIENLQHQNTYRAHLKKVFGNETKTHDLRFTYAKNLFNKKIAEGLPYKQALKEVSEEINHHREQMTIYYLKRA